LFWASSENFPTVKFTPDKLPIYGETLESLGQRLSERKQPLFRAGQIMDWLYKKRVQTWSEMTNLPSSLRDWLSETFDIFPTQFVLEKSSEDVTNKLLLRLGDGSLIETVIIRAPQRGVGQDSSRKTICISTQVGCAYGCRFCASGLAGFKRDLSPGEIVSQLIQICHLEDPNTSRDKNEIASFDNIVVMGMGEPLANYDNLIQALKILNAPWGLNFGARRITVSTSGLVPQMIQLASEPMQFRLALSLHGATNDVREQIMPINRRYPLEKLIPAAKLFAEKHGHMLTLEFILIEEINDTIAQADALIKIARDLHAHVNLIPYNTVQGLTWKRPSLRRQNVFLEKLQKNKIPVTIRREKGHDIDAACGQLRLQVEENGETIPAN
jgi:23S rRNA (adenine2503-C2)-methyltransferase